VEKALLQAFNTTEISDIRLLAGGLSGSMVYKITVNNESYVLKLDSPEETAGPGTRPYTSMEIAVNAGIAPPLYYLNREDALFISKFIENQPLRAVFTSPDLLLTTIANTITAIHKMPAIPKENSLLTTVETLIRQVRESPMFTKTIFEDFFDYYDIIRKHYPWDDTDKVPSHNDLNPNNIICDGKKIWIVDWDAAFQNDRYVDLAISANFFVSNATQEKIFLEAYFGDGLSSCNSARFFIMRQITRLIYAILMFKLASSSDPAGVIDDPGLQTANMRKIGELLGTGKLSLSSYRGQLLYGKALLNEALTDMRSPRFIPSVEALANSLSQGS
jgi:hypothetical protein